MSYILLSGALMTVRPVLEQGLEAISMKKILVAAFLAIACVFPATASAQNLSTNELRKLIVGKVISLDDGARITYGANGNYRYNGGSPGKYTIGSGGKVCVRFTTGQRRCDRYVKRGGAYYLVNASGGEWKVK